MRPSVWYTKRVTLSVPGPGSASSRGAQRVLLVNSSWFWHFDLEVDVHAGQNCKSYSSARTLSMGCAYHIGFSASCNAHS
jgi:hypothetical protein